ncbi:putative enzyme of poly-gamma-glutamate biosynthesis (capsule formation) [Roseibacterium elongatum DSM 19469]|uniref:Putative enzyme of poly-gamma-glutamate biosynthesis (Capsule formation) n=1 Tax=Roseicyclus elongatus DSM 19469 TaxID=1294273 RepID=W8STH5_9RHOB|nr:CapA family protein [Roseibacterium elongatum]AHM05835.1 putative enzyme of poly-gamma-glutamate biosynthesis (capsule formation) [Roseibacterium elongatum DSM 19469]
MLALVLAACVPNDASGPSVAARAGTCPSEVGVFRAGAATVAAAGDVLLHRLIQQDATARPEGFTPAFAPVAPYLSRSDLTIVNLEGPAARGVLPGGRAAAVAPEVLFDDRVYSGYPQFNYHPSIASALRSIGIDVVQTANNHALDRGPLGVDRTLAALAEAGLRSTGTRARGSDGPWHTTVRLSMAGGAAKVAILACTYDVNGLPNPHDQALLCYGSNPSVPGLIEALSVRPQIDAVILTPHWGQEYSASPDARQRRLARAAIEAGAAAVIGAHPHVLQPIEEITASDGRRGFVAYSLGNFLSSQWALPRRTGAILYFDLARDARGRVIAHPPRALVTRGERYASQGVAVAPAATIPNGAASLAHAERILGAGRVISPEDLACAR